MKAAYAVREERDRKAKAEFMRMIITQKEIRGDGSSCISRTYTASPIRPGQPLPMPTPATHTLVPIRTECPPGACVCAREELLNTPTADIRVLLLTRDEEKRLLDRLENLTSLQELRRIEARLADQLGIRLRITIGPREVRTVRGIAILVAEQPGLCRKTRQSIPAAIRVSLDRHPQIMFDLLDGTGLFGADEQPQ